MSMFRKHAPDWLLREALRAYARGMYRQYVQERAPSSASQTEVIKESNEGASNASHEDSTRLSASTTTTPPTLPMGGEGK